MPHSILGLQRLASGHLVLRVYSGSARGLHKPWYLSWRWGPCLAHNSGVCVASRCTCGGTNSLVNSRERPRLEPTSDLSAPNQNGQQPPLGYWRPSRSDAHPSNSIRLPHPPGIWDPAYKVQETKTASLPASAHPTTSMYRKRGGQSGPRSSSTAGKDEKRHSRPARRTSRNHSRLQEG